ncbi:MAG: ADP-ribosylglycohydrolase family protein [Armatimonadota bacterium]|nr:ADP-ribosylglycohydrolase family protein [Armatimonadota bacterium]
MKRLTLSLLIIVIIALSAIHLTAAPLSEKYYYNKVHGAWLGKCIGGALGMPMEGWPYYQIQKQYGDNIPYLNYFAENMKKGWSGAVKTVTIPADSDWRHVTASLTIPDFDQGCYAIPIIGMTQEAGGAKRKLLIRNLRILRPVNDSQFNSWYWMPMEGCRWIPGTSDVEFDYDGSRAWTRMKHEAALRLNLKPGDKMIVAFDAKRISGDSEIIIAFDYHLKAAQKGFGPDDDTTYEIVGLHTLEIYGPDISCKQIGEQWIKLIGPAYGGTLAEEIARTRMAKGIWPPESGNHDAGEAIGGQMKAEIWGLVCPGRPDLAAEYARRDGVVAHHDNGVYGEQFIAVIIAASFYEKDVRKLIDVGLKHIPSDCKYASVVKEVIAWQAKYPNWRDTIKEVKDEYPGICDPVYAEAGIVTLALLYGNGDFDKSITIAAKCGSDTDCNTATVGAIIGCIKGAKAIPNKWKEPLGDQFRCGAAGLEEWKISELAKRICATGNKVMSHHGDGIKFTEKL